jgi:hypothetical protein
MLLEQVRATLDEAGVRYALIGASALTIHGVSRATLDLDLLAMDSVCLQPGFWAGLESRHIEVEVRRGGLEDPLAGVVRLRAGVERPVDLVLGKYTWQREILERARPMGEEADLPVIRAADLILLKLFAGGPQDAWDIQQLLLAEDREELIAEVEQNLPRLPPRCASLWNSLHRH